ncbi:MAG TPA: EamA family transporter [Beijerinckiaceae bacterium]|jgi:drug/metabolite transporter (DMT)-like permease|nr:EamA family transporter [Beijerinckiaceae bacterium]
MFPHLWIPITLIASCAQTARNATQASLTATLGPVGSAQVRFLYGLPFALLFLAAQLAASREALPAIGTKTALFALVGASAQILATVLMLAAMQMKSFAVTTATTKTEPVLVAIFGVVMLGDRPSLVAWAAILIATAGVIIMSLRPARTMSGGGLLDRGGAPAIVMGVMSGGCFAIAAICFRGAILALPEASLHLRATLVLVLGLGMQTLMLLAYLTAFDRPALFKSFSVWQVSLGAGFFGALASQFWFLGFALTSAANVRTLALVEVLLAQIVQGRMFAQHGTRQDLIGMALIVVGAGALIVATA